MPKVKPVIAMKQRLQQVLCELAEQEEVIELIKQAVQKYELQPTDVFAAEDLETAIAPVLVDETIPYCDRAGNTWSGKGRRPTWLVEVIAAGAALGDFKNPWYSGV